MSARSEENCRILLLSVYFFAPRPVFGEILWLQKVTTQFQGFCYNLTSVLTNKYMMKQYTEILIYFNKSASEENLPTSLKIFITSEKNSYGIGLDDWKNGKIFKTRVDKGMYKNIDIKPIQHSYLTTKCSHESFHQCMSRLIAKDSNGSSSLCSPFSLPSLPVCNINKTNEEGEFWMAWSKSYGKCSINLCITLEYSGEETYYEESNIKNLTFKFSYKIPSNSTTFYEEYLVYDGIDAIGSVGGSLGMCIGFSFSNLISSLINILQHVIFIIKLKFTDRKLTKPNNESLKISLEIEDKDKQNETTYVEGYSRKEKSIEDRFEEKISNKLQVELEDKDLKFEFRSLEKKLEECTKNLKAIEIKSNTKYTN